MYTDNELLLNKAKDLLKSKMPSISYSTWIKGLKIASVSDNKIVLVTQTEMQKDALIARHSELLETTFNFITNKQCEITVITNEEKEQQDKSFENIENTEDNNFSKSQNYNSSFLKPEYTFDTFVIGNNNKFAHAAAYAVSQEPASNYNPLYIYGGVGLGKTHLMHAIGNEIIRKDPSKKVLYVTSETFINDLVNSIKDPNFKNELFRDKYRKVDILLVDDIQFIANKRLGQEEFFHTFNALKDAEKQIIISSDKAPRDIQGLQERLKSRFEGGILADVSVPDYETRLAILRRKVQLKNIIFDDYLLSLIATRIDSNIRELEGCLEKIIAFTNLTHSPITIDIVEKTLNEYIHQKEKIISADYIQEVVAKYFNIPKEDLISSKKSNDIAYPRQIAMYLCRNIASMTFPKIGAAFGGRDHTTVMHAYNKIEKEIKENKENSNTKDIVESVKNIIRESN
ncbi:MAG: chromosomal replication initiator protein DnaA [Clostridia bacterium]|nr:chromosomal replication initiator protein DnaA [Clostridia bacterium]